MTARDPVDSITNLLRCRMRDSQLSDLEISRRAGLHELTVHNFKNNKHTATLHTICAIGQVFGLQLHWGE